MKASHRNDCTCGNTYRLSAVLADTVFRIEAEIIRIVRTYRRNRRFPCVFADKIYRFAEKACRRYAENAFFYGGFDG